MAQPKDVNDQALDDARFRAINRRYRIATTAAIGLACALMAIYGFALTHALATKQQFPIGWVINWLPAAFYLWALWQLRAWFGELSGELSAEKSAPSGHGRSPAKGVAAVVGRVGWALMLGAATTWLPVFSFFSSPAPRGGTLVIFLVPAMTLFAVGLALAALAPMLQRALAMEARAAALKAELDEFF